MELQWKNKYSSESKNFNATEFDERLASAVTGFQQKYKAEVLSPSGLLYGTGYVGKLTRAKLNKLYGCNNNTVSNPTPTSGTVPSVSGSNSGASNPVSSSVSAAAGTPIACSSYTTSASCTGSLACEWYGTNGASATCHIPSCGGLLNVMGKSDTTKYEGGFYPSGAPASQGWIYAGVTNGCGTAPNDTCAANLGCFYRAVGSTPPPSTNPPPTTPPPVTGGSYLGRPDQLASGCSVGQANQCGGKSSCIAKKLCIDGPYSGDCDMNVTLGFCGGVASLKQGPCGADAYYHPAFQGPNFRTVMSYTPTNISLVPKGSTIIFSAQLIYEGQVVGSDNPTVTVAWYKDGVEVSRVTKPIQSEVQTLYQNITADGKKHTIKVVIDPEDRVYEYVPVCNSSAKGSSGNTGETDNSVEAYLPMGLQDATVTGVTGVTSGGNITTVTRRDAMVQLINRAGLVSTPPASASFGDVPTYDSGYAQIETAYVKGITFGCSASPRQFCPNRAITRYELGTFTSRVGGSFNATVNPTGNASISDVDLAIMSIK